MLEFKKHIFVVYNGQRDYYLESLPLLSGETPDEWMNILHSHVFEFDTDNTKDFDQKNFELDKYDDRLVERNDNCTLRFLIDHSDPLVIRNISNFVYARYKRWEKINIVIYMSTSQHEHVKGFQDASKTKVLTRNY